VAQVLLHGEILRSLEQLDGARVTKQQSSQDVCKSSVAACIESLTQVSSVGWR
jgi:hypothetical protein